MQVPVGRGGRHTCDHGRVIGVLNVEGEIQLRRRAGTVRHTHGHVVHHDAALEVEARIGSDKHGTGLRVHVEGVGGALADDGEGERRLSDSVVLVSSRKHNDLRALRSALRHVELRHRVGELRQVVGIDHRDGHLQDGCGLEASALRTSAVRYGEVQQVRAGGLEVKHRARLHGDGAVRGDREAVRGSRWCARVR